jgi:hypothetical protein
MDVFSTEQGISGGGLNPLSVRHWPLPDYFLLSHYIYLDNRILKGIKDVIEASVRSGISLCEICGVQSRTKVGF